MRAYRVYWFGGEHVERVEVHDADSDEEVVAIVRAKKLPRRSEIWEGNRLVAELPAYREPRD